MVSIGSVKSMDKSLYSVRQCGSNELPHVIDRMDQEFVFGKRHTLSLHKRFPNIFSADKLELIRVVASKGSIVGAHVMRIFDWITKERTWRGSMVGMVWTDPDFRGKKIGTHLMIDTEHYLRKAKVDFGVLWTSSHAFYENVGWFLNSHGLFSKVMKHPDLPCSGVVSCRPLPSVDIAWLENLRSRFDDCRIVRNVLDYQVVPVPAVGVLCFSARGDDGSEGFALVGEQDKTGYFYEMMAPPVLWDSIWAAVVSRFEPLYANGLSGDAFSQWLADHGYVSWQPQSRTMWLRVSDRLEPSLMDAWHIPYYDWI